MSALSPDLRQLSPLQRAAFAVREMRLRLDQAEAARREPIAVVGIGCRFPGGATTPDRFWALLRDGRDGVGPVPPDRWDSDRFYHPDPSRPGTISTRHGGFLEQVDRFDAAAFGISASEADSLDPQQRLLLEVTWEALEHAACAPTRLRDSRTGVFIGIGQNDYARHRLLAGDPDGIGPYDGTGNGFCFAAGRLSFVLGLRGPNLAVDTACSGSLVSTHLACQSLRLGECDLALSGGVQLILSPEVSVFLSRAGALSPDGRCRTFGAGANGYGRGEGCGVVVLKRLSDAERDADDILAVIRGSAVNHDGPSSGLTVPSAPAQTALLREALERAALEPDEIDYIEAHGTATALGDPIEIAGLTEVFGRREPDNPLRLGSVKTNIGHLEAAAGVAGLIKVVLALRHQQIPPHIQVDRLNPTIRWDRLPFQVTTSAASWPVGRRPRRAGVSAFGISGTNAHVVVEEAPPAPPRPLAGVRRRTQVVSVSARSAAALGVLATRYAAHLRGTADVALGDVSYTANTGRAAWAERLCVVASGVEEAAVRLDAASAARPATGVLRGRAGRAPRVGWLCPPVSGWAAAGPRLYREEPVFRAAVDAVVAAVPETVTVAPETLVGLTLPDETSSTAPTAAVFAAGAASASSPGQAAVAELARGCGLAALWQAWGVRPWAVTGAGVGAYVAAVTAGVFGAAEAARLLVAHVRVVSGGGAATDRQALATLAAEVAYRAPRVRYVTAPEPDEPDGKDGLDASQVPDAVLTPAYWARPPAAAAALAPAGCELVLELGVTAGTRRPEGMLPGGPGGPAGANGSVGVDATVADSLFPTLAALWVRGAAVDWDGVHRGDGHRKITLPGYPWERSRHWVSPPTQAAARLDTAVSRSSTDDAPTVRVLTSAVSRPEIELEARLEPTTPLQHQHRVHGRAVTPGALFLELALRCASATGRGAAVLEQVRFLRPLAATDRPTTIRIVLTPSGSDTATFEIFAESAAGDRGDGHPDPIWRLLVTGRLDSGRPLVAAAVDLVAVAKRLGERISARTVYDRLASEGLELGPRFQCFDEIQFGGDEVLARLSRSPQADRRLDPALLDGCTVLRQAIEPDVVGVPVQTEIGVFAMYRDLAESVWVHVRRDPGDETATITLLDDGGRPTAAIERQRLTSDLAHRPVALPCYRVAWVPADGPSGEDAALDEIAAAVRPLAATRLGEAAVRRFVTAEAELESICADVAYATVRQLGGGVDLPDRFGTEALALALGVAPARRRLFQRTLEILGEAGRLVRDGEVWLHRPAQVPNDIGPRLATLATDVPEVAAECQIVERCAGRLTDLLQGRGEPLAVLFPPADDAGPPPCSAETLYRDSIPARVMNGLLAETLGQLARTRDPGRPPRVLEIGAGTGASTVAALGSLPEGAEYWFTDISPAFVRQASRTLVDPRLRFSTFDIEHPAPEQSVDEGRFDFVIASNVLHATRSLGATMDQVARLLVPGGVLLLVEGTARRRWVDLIFGLTDGWWRFVDTDLRPAHPLIGVEAWRAVLAGHRFSEVVAIPDSEGAGDLSQSLLVARRSADVGTAIRRWFVVGGPGLARQALVDTLTVAGAEVAHSGQVPVPTAGSGPSRDPRFESNDRVSDSADGEHEALRRFVMSDPAAVCGVAFLCGLGPGGPDRTARQPSLAGDGDGADAEVEARADADLSDVALGMMQRSVSMVRVLQATCADGAHPRLWFVTRDTQPVGAATVDGLSAAPVWGIARTLALESPELFGGAVDLGPGDPSTALGALGRRLIRGVEACDEYAVRDDARFVPRLEAVPVDAAAEALVWPLEGTCLITGGLGAFGLAVAERLARRGVGALCLVGRRGPRTEDTRRRLTALEAQGVSVRVESLDVADEPALRALLASIDTGPHPLRGVIHAAGVTGLGPLWDQTDDTVAAIARPKIAGAWVLHRLTRDRDLRFFVCLSSMVSLWGARGQGPYAAANHFLDALAHHRRRLGLPAMTVNWGPLSGGGMVPADMVDALARLGVTATPIGRAVETLDRLLDGRWAQPVAVEIDWDRFAAAHGTRRTTMMFDRVRSAPRSRPAETPDSAAALRRAVPGERRALVLDRLRALLGLVIPVTDEIDTTTGLFDLGLDSLGSMEFRRRLEQAFGFAVPQTLLFNHGTLDGIADVVLAQLERPGTEPVLPAAGDREAGVAYPLDQGEALGHGGSSRPPDPADPADLDHLDDLDEAEVEALLRRRLEEIG